MYLPAEVFDLHLAGKTPDSIPAEASQLRGASPQVQLGHLLLAAEVPLRASPAPEAEAPLHLHAAAAYSPTPPSEPWTPA